MKNVAVIAPAGSIENPEKLIAAQNFMKQFNIETKFTLAAMKHLGVWRDAMKFD